MRFSHQFDKYLRELDDHHPRGTIVCTWLKRDRGRLPRQVDVLVSPEAAVHFKIDGPCVLDKGRALRIICWQKQRSVAAKPQLY